MVIPVIPRVTAFVLLSPLAGAIADRYDRKRIMVITHLARMVIVALLPFVTAIWQVYALIFALNVFNAFFTPTYKATIPQVTGENDYPQAIALSSATYQYGLSKKVYPPKVDAPLYL